LAQTSTAFTFLALLFPFSFTNYPKKQQPRLSFDGRVEYVENKLKDIFAAADDPLKNDWWLNKDDCWQLLAGCFELTAALRSPDPKAYHCRLPIHQDGSCNGLQHYAALGGDVDGATSVNLIESEIPQDVYSRVAHLVAKLVDDDFSNPQRKDHEVAKLVKGKVDRKVVKQTVMTNVYGVTFIGARLQIEARLKDRGDIPEDDLYACSVYLAKKIFESLERMFTGAREIQFWLTNSARQIASSRPLTAAEITAEQTNYSDGKKKRRTRPKKDARSEDGAEDFGDDEDDLHYKEEDYGEFDEDEDDDESAENAFPSHAPFKSFPSSSSLAKTAKREKRAKKEARARKLDAVRGMTNVSWTTPLGLPVVQPYRKNLMRSISTQLQSVQIKDMSVPGVSNVVRQKSAFPPNFIHSLDSTHMFMTALACQLSPERITFASVHDSFWTHASTVDTLNNIIREEFINLHSQPIMDRLRQEFLNKYNHHVIFEAKDVTRGGPVRIPPIPKRGEFDIKHVKGSKYFFD